MVHPTGVVLKQFRDDFDRKDEPLFSTTSISLPGRPRSRLRRETQFLAPIDDPSRDGRIRPSVAAAGLASP